MRRRPVGHFCTVDDVGVIILDEEHETTYKQEENPRYHTRDVASWRAAYHQCPVVLGSATPILETYARAQKGVYRYLPLKERFGGELPPVDIIDMRKELERGNRTPFKSAAYRRHQTTNRTWRADGLAVESSWLYDVCPLP